MITIHEAKAADFTTLGMGALLPTECTVRERAGGMYELKIVHPITDDGRHQRIKPMRIIKAPAPMRETPLIEIGQAGTAARDIYRVATNGMRLNMRAGASMESKVIHAYKPGTEVVKLGEEGSWMRVAIMDGGATGWMWAENLEFVRTETEVIVGDTSGGIVQPRQTREQLFRIYRYSPDSKERAVTAEARHITYDLAGAVVEGEYSPENVAADQVCAQIMAKADHDVSDFHIYCTVSTPISGEYGGRNILDCLLDPETGIVAQSKARIVRDNYDVFILPDEVRSRGVELRYGKNLLSAYMDTDVSDTITRIKPVGKTRNGEKLYIETNGGWVESPYISDYPVVYSKEVEYDVVESDELPIDQARTLLKEKAEVDFLAGCDMATVKLDADFVRLELTEDYKHLANQYALHLYDSVPVIDREADIVATARMTEYAYDAILDEYRDTGLGELEEVKSTIYGYELAAGTVSGGKLIPNTVNGDRLQNLSVNYGKFDLAAIKQLSADAVTAIRADIRELVAGNITTDQLYADLAVIAAAQITAANIEKANIQWAQIAELTAEIARIANAEIAKAEIDWAQIKNAQIDAADITNLTAAVATIVQAEIAIAEIDWARIKNVEVDTAQIKLGAITQALIAAGAIGTAQIADGSITSAKIVELTADLIKTGTLSADRLLIKGAGGLFYEINAQAGGLTSTQLTEEQYKNAISGTALVAKSVTAAQIAAKTITANEILSGTITAAEIDVANLFAAEATIAALDAYILRTNTIESLKGSLDIWASEKVRLAVDGVQIGGRNLLRNTAELRTANYSFDASGAETLGSYAEDDEGGFHIVCDGANVRWWPGIQPVTPGQSYAMSVRYRMNSGEAPIQFQYVFQNASGDGVDYYDSNRLGTTKSLTEGGWTILQSVFTVPENAAIVRVNLAARTGSDYALYNCDYNIRRPKFERGTKATDWSPAPEDTDETIAEVSAELAVQAGEISAKVNQSEFNALGERVTSAESAITLHSDQIASKVERTEFDALGNQVSANSSAITQTATQIRSEVASSVSGLQTQIDQTEDQVLILAGRSVGGTNMIRNTGTLKKANYSFDASGASALGSYAEDDEGGFHIVCDNANVRCWMGEYAVSPGQSYAMSARYRMNSGNAPIQFQYVLKSTGGADLYYWDSVNHGTPGTVTEDGWTVLRSVFAVPDDPAVTKVSIALRTGVDGALYTCDYNIRRPKFESGSMPTDWTPSPDDPSNGLDTGSGSGVRVKITPDEFDVDVPGTDGDFTLNRTGARIPVVNSDVVYAQNLAYRYYGAADIYVNAAASGDQIAAGSHYRSLTDALNTLSGKYIPYDVRIHVESDTYGNLSLTGAYGRTVTVNGGGRAVYGRMDIMDNALRTFVSNLTVAGDGTDAAVRLAGEGWSNWNDCTINGSGSGSGIAVYDGAKAMLLGCGLYNATNLLYAGHASDISAIALKGGGGTNFAQLDGCTIKFSRTRPDGTLSVANTPICKPDDPTTLPIDYGTATPTTPTISTASWNYLYSDSYCTGWSYFSDDDVRQGYNGETIYGVIWFDAATIRSALSGKTINQASLRLHMHGGVGRGVAVSVQLYGTNMDYSGRTGTPGLAAAYGTIGSTTPNEINEITIHTQVITDIVNGTIQALVLKSDDTALYKDRAYSQNYAKFSGSSTATAENCPRLTVVYQ